MVDVLIVLPWNHMGSVKNGRDDIGRSGRIVLVPGDQQETVMALGPLGITIQVLLEPLVTGGIWAVVLVMPLIGHDEGNHGQIVKIPLGKLGKGLVDIRRHRTGYLKENIAVMFLAVTRGSVARSGFKGGWRVSAGGGPLRREIFRIISVFQMPFKSWVPRQLPVTVLPQASSV